MSKLIFPAHSDSRYNYEDENNYELPSSAEENFVWTDRADYLEWVTEWKAELKRRIALIREEKAKRRNKSLEVSERNAANWARQLLRIDCYNLLVLRKIGKIRSARQREQLRQQAAD